MKAKQFASTKLSASHKFSFSLKEEDFAYLQSNFHLFGWCDCFHGEVAHGRRTLHFKTKTTMLEKKFNAADFLFAKINGGKVTEINPA